jgi:hypothetical protein
MLLDGRAPAAGEVMKNPDLARTYRSLAKDGITGFYTVRGTSMVFFGFFPIMESLNIFDG